MGYGVLLILNIHKKGLLHALSCLQNESTYGGLEGLMFLGLVTLEVFPISFLYLIPYFIRVSGDLYTAGLEQI
jgi:hypothetical protein